MRSLHQHLPQIHIAFLRDPQLRLLLARFAPLRPQAYIATYIPALLEALLVFHRQHECQSDQWSHSFDLRRSSVSGYCPRAICSSSLAGPDLLCQGFHLLNSGFSPARSSIGSPAACSSPIASASQAGSRSPAALVSPRAAFTRLVRASTSAARTLICIRSVCACSPGAGSAVIPGPPRHPRQHLCIQPVVFRLLWLISFSCRELATITSYPRLASSRLTHGECVPTSMAIRHQAFPNNRTLPSSSCRHCLPLRSRRLRPARNIGSLVPQVHSNRCSVIAPFFLPRFALDGQVLCFFMAGLLCTSSASKLGAYRIPLGGRPLIPSRFNVSFRRGVAVF